MGSTPISVIIHPKYQEVIKLRKRGKSYREIAKRLNISKNSVSRWCKNLKLPLFARRILKRKTKAVLPKLIAANEKKHRIVQAENKEIREHAFKEIPCLSQRELLLIGAALYWAEGYKKQDKTPSPRISFVNSDPDMVRLFLYFLREIVKVPEEKFYPNIRIHPNINKRKAINFWAKTTGIPKERFRISYQISRLSRGKRPKHSLLYGTLQLAVNSRKKFYQIRGWIDGLVCQSKGSRHGFDSR